MSFVREWGWDNNGAYNRFAGPRGVATDGYDIYVADTRNGVVEKYAYGRKYLGHLVAPGSFDYPVGVALDNTGDVYVSQDGSSSIDEFTAGGAFVQAWGTIGTGKGQFLDPAGV